MLLSEQPYDGVGSHIRRSMILSERRDDAALFLAYGRWRRSVRRFDRAVSAAARRADKGMPVVNALVSGIQTTKLVQGISKINAATLVGLQRKVSICIDTLEQCGIEPAQHIDDLILSCLNDANRLLSYTPSIAEPSPCVDPSAACSATLELFTDGLRALENDCVPAAQEDQFLSQLLLRDHELKANILRLAQYHAKTIPNVAAKGDILRRLIVVGHWECLHRRDLALSYCEDLYALTVPFPKSPSLLLLATRSIKSFARR